MVEYRILLKKCYDDHIVLNWKTKCSHWVYYNVYTVYYFENPQVYSQVVGVEVKKNNIQIDITIVSILANILDNNYFLQMIDLNCLANIYTHLLYTHRRTLSTKLMRISLHTMYYQAVQEKEFSTFKITPSIWSILRVICYTYNMSQYIKLIRVCLQGDLKSSIILCSDTCGNIINIRDSIPLPDKSFTAFQTF